MRWNGVFWKRRDAESRGARRAAIQARWLQRSWVTLNNIAVGRTRQCKLCFKCFQDGRFQLEKTCTDHPSRQIKVAVRVHEPIFEPDSRLRFESDVLRLNLSDSLPKWYSDAAQH